MNSPSFKREGIGNPKKNIRILKLKKSESYFSHFTVINSYDFKISHGSQERDDPEGTLNLHLGEFPENLHSTTQKPFVRHGSH